MSRFVRRRNCDSDIAVTFSTCPPTASWGDHLRKEFGDCTKYQADVIVGNTINYSIYYIYIYIQCLNYFTSSDPHHDMLGGGCQVRVVIENMMGRMENLRTLISGFLGLVILVRWALVTMFLS